MDDPLHIRKKEQHIIKVKSDFVITNSSGSAIFVRNNWGIPITGLICVLKMTNLTLKYVRYNRVSVNNRVRYNLVYYIINLTRYIKI
jgi:hypothetical protein